MIKRRSKPICRTTQNVPPSEENLKRKFKLLAQESKINYLGFWEDIYNQRRFLESLTHIYHIEEHQDWYNITLGDVYQRRGSTLLSLYYNSSLIGALKTIYPEYNWKEKRSQA